MFDDFCNQEYFFVNLNGLLAEENFTNQNDDIARRKYVQNRLSSGTIIYHEGDQSRRG